MVNVCWGSGTSCWHEKERDLKPGKKVYEGVGGMSEIYIGQEVTEEKIFDKKDVVEIAKITGDNNPLHLD